MQFGWRYLAAAHFH